MKKLNKRYLCFFVVGLLLSAAQATLITPDFNTNLTYMGEQNGQHAWQLYVKNITPIADDNYSGISLKVNAENTSDHSYWGGTIGDFWQTETITDNYFESSTWSPIGNINPTVLDADADELWINFLSDYSSLVDSTVVIDTLDFYTVVVDQQLPGYIPEPATFTLLIFGSSIFLRRRL